MKSLALKPKEAVSLMHASESFKVDSLPPSHWPARLSGELCVETGEAGSGSDDQLEGQSTHSL